MTNRQHVPASGLTTRDLELVERIVYKNGDDIAVSITRSLERLEERIDSAESRLHSRLAELAETTAMPH